MEKEQDNIKGQLFDNLRGLISIVDQLRDVGVQEYIKLPRIAVLGTQSAGKSSLLESIVGLDFLPRGDGVVTRRPLEMRLVHKPDTVKPWAYFGTDKQKKFTDFELVRKEIDAQTDQVAGANKGIVNDPIILTIYSSDCPDLTIIDLPGITRIPLKGTDQKVDIEQVTTNMAKFYCEQERTVILCVIPANQDVSTSDALKMAKTLDPNGTRTLGVITKIDIMDRGTDARRMLLGQDVELKLGYVGVKNRSQLDINDKVKVQKALTAEEEYFASHPVYSTLPKECLGTKALVQKLTTILFKHISQQLPQITKEIDQKIKDCEEKLLELGPSLPRDNKERMHLIWSMLTDYTENFKNQIRGKYDIKMNSKQNSQEVSGGAMIKQMLNELYSDFSHPSYRATHDYDRKHIERAITLHQGDSIPGFPSFDSFLYLIMPQLDKLKEPSMDTLNEIFIYMDSLSNNILKKVFVRFPQVLDEISDISSRVLQEQRDKARVVVENIIDSELGYIFTNDADYLTSKASLVPQSQEPIANGESATNAKETDAKTTPQQKQPQKNEKIAVPVDPKKLLGDELRSRVDAYYALVIRNLRDSIPKAIGFFLVRQTQEQMQYQLYSEIMKNQQVMQLLDEPEYIAQERDTVSQTIKVLRNAQKVLRKDPDLAFKETSRFDQLKNDVVSKVKQIFK